jgi:HAD superfamily phosphatase (TIGR01668 family)
MNLLIPHYKIDRVEDITPAWLKELGINSLLVDVDCTLKSYRTERAAEEVIGWFEAMREGGIGICLVSNGLAMRIGPFAEILGLPFVAPAGKPLTWGLERAIGLADFEKETTAMVGDQIFSDVLAGRRLGILTMLVTPIAPHEEPWFARLKRPIEKIVIRYYRKKIEYPVFEKKFAPPPPSSTEKEPWEEE